VSSRRWGPCSLALHQQRRMAERKSAAAPQGPALEPGQRQRFAQIRPRSRAPWAPPPELGAGSQRTGDCGEKPRGIRKPREPRQNASAKSMRPAVIHSQAGRLAQAGDDPFGNPGLDRTLVQRTEHAFWTSTHTTLPCGPTIRPKATRKTPSRGRPQDGHAGLHVRTQNPVGVLPKLAHGTDQQIPHPVRTKIHHHAPPSSQPVLGGTFCGLISGGHKRF